jgi:hypothetical protein
VAKGSPTVNRLSVGTSGWSYPSWRPGFYPAGLDPSGFLAFYAERFSTVELNTTGYRLPAEEQFRRWAEQVPDGFEFAPKLPGERPRTVAEFENRVRHLGDRLGPMRISLKSKRDEGILELWLGSLDPSLRLAFDLEHPRGTGSSRGSPRQAPSASATSAIRRRSATSGAGRLRTRRSPPPWPRPRSPSTSTSATTTSRRRPPMPSGYASYCVRARRRRMPRVRYTAAPVTPARASVRTFVVTQVRQTPQQA